MVYEDSWGKVFVDTHLQDLRILSNFTSVPVGSKCCGHGRAFQWTNGRKISYSGLFIFEAPYFSPVQQLPQ